MKTAVKPEPQQNHLLAALSPEVQARLFPYLELVPLPLRAIMYEARRPMRHVYFPTDSIVSLQYILENGASTAILVVGNEGLLGISLYLGGESTPSRSLVQSAGCAYRLPRQRVKDEFNRHGELLVLMLRYTQALITQIAQTAVCNRHHSVDKQLCRWLLLSMDRLSHNRLTMTQEFIGNMLGVRREGVTQAAMRLQKEGVISYSRGLITVLDQPKLETLSCECYEVVKTETEHLLNYLPQRQTITVPEAIPTVTLPIAPPNTEVVPTVALADSPPRTDAPPDTDTPPNVDAIPTATLPISDSDTQHPFQHQRHSDSDTSRHPFQHRRNSDGDTSSQSA